MTMTHRRSSKQEGGTSANPARGWRIERIIGRPPHRTEAGRIALPLWLSSDGRHVADGALVMTADEAAELRAHLDRLLGDGGQGPGDGS